MKTRLLHGLRAVVSAAVAIGTAAAVDPHVRDLVAHEVQSHPGLAAYVPFATLAISAFWKWRRDRRNTTKAPPPV